MFVCGGKLQFYNFNCASGKMTRRSSRTIYVGNLPGDIRLREVEDLFYKVPMFIMLLIIYAGRYILGLLFYMVYFLVWEIYLFIYF